MPEDAKTYSLKGFKPTIWWGLGLSLGSQAGCLIDGARMGI